MGGRGYYSRIPWDGPNQPLVSGHAGSCFVCTTGAERTVMITPGDLGKTMHFCSDDCYLDWWKTRHPLPPGWGDGPQVVAGRPFG